MLQLCAIFISKSGIVLEAYHGRRSVVVKCRSEGIKLHDKTEGKWAVVRLGFLASTICGISQYFQVLCNLKHFWGNYHVIYCVVVVVCKACVLPYQVSCYSSVEDAVAGGTAQPQQLLVPPAWCHHVPELRRRAGVFELWDLQIITQRCAIHRICLFISVNIELGDIYENTTAVLPHLSADLAGSCHRKVLVSKYDRKLLVCQC